MVFTTMPLLPSPTGGAAFSPGVHAGAYSRAFANGSTTYDISDGTIRHPYSRAALASVFPQYQEGSGAESRYRYQAYDNLQNFFQTGLISNTSVNIANRLSEGTSINFQLCL